MAKQRPKLGDIFEIDLGGGNKAYMQYVANDETQLGSEVIRVFKRRYSPGDVFDPAQIVDDEVEFFAHTFVSSGINEGLWSNVGNVSRLGKINVLFRDSDDYGDPEVEISEKWFVWKIGKKTKFVGRLSGKYKDSEIGVVIPAEFIVERIAKGEYQFTYPDH